MDAIKAVFDSRNAESHLSPQVIPGRMAPIVLAMRTGGVDIVEVCGPFSDFIADSPVIQGTNLIALQNRVDYATILGQVKDARSKDLAVPVLVMGHYNPILAHGENKAPEEALGFRENCTSAGTVTSLHRLSYLTSIVDSFISIVSRGSWAANFLMSSLVLAHTPQCPYLDAVVEVGADSVAVGSRIVSSLANQAPQVVENFRRGLLTPLRWSSKLAIPLPHCRRNISTDWNDASSTALWPVRLPPTFWAEFENHYGYTNRPSKLPVYFAEILTGYANGTQTWLKREDLNRTGSHKTNNAVGQMHICPLSLNFFG
ncbi:hypothetical protein BKA83DRAFT_4495098 [Pisolithus microcarpus]|nr:hypothetical protein BKA83DRAFT_4495098 [Pisolithus microcarpus]